MTTKADLLYGPPPAPLRLLADRTEHAISAGEWTPLVQAFLGGMAQLGKIAQDEREPERTLYPPTASAPSWTVGYKLTMSVAKHNAYHFGQIALVRRLLGART